MLIMTSSLRTSELLSEFLDDMDPDAAPGSQGKKMMERKLRWYIHGWQRMQLERRRESRTKDRCVPKPKQAVQPASNSGEISAALKKKDEFRQAQAASRRRTRGGAPAPTQTRTATNETGTSQDQEVIDVDQLEAL